MKFRFPKIPKDYNNPNPLNTDTASDFQCYVSSIWPNVNFDLVEDSVGNFYLETEYSTDKEKEVIYNIKANWPISWNDAKKRAHMNDLCDDGNCFDE